MTAASRGAVVVFAKAPRPGSVKTRLSPPLSAEQAAQLYAHMLDDVLVATAEVARDLSLDPIVAVHPPDARREIARRAPPEFRVVAQCGRDLGQRMTWAALEAAAGGARHVLLRGSDSPVLAADRVAGALDRLADADVAICPDADGGYSLIGLRVALRGLFDHAMSTSSVLEDTLANARRLGLRASLLPPTFDIDTVEDLTRLAAARERGETTLCPRLLQFLDEEQLWPPPRGEPGVTRSSPGRSSGG